MYIRCHRLVVGGVPFRVGCVLYVMKNWLRTIQQSASPCDCHVLTLAAMSRYLSLCSTQTLCADHAQVGIPSIRVWATVSHGHNTAFTVLQVCMIKDLIRKLPIWRPEYAFATLPCPCRNPTQAGTTSFTIGLCGHMLGFSIPTNILWKKEWR